MNPIQPEGHDAAISGTKSLFQRGGQLLAGNPAPPPPRAWHAVQKTLALLLLFGAGSCLYLPTLSFDFLSWDDTRYILNNALVRQLSFDNVLTIFSKPYFYNYLPLHLFSYQLDFALWGPKAFGFHLHSLLLHGLNVILACLTLTKLGSPWPVAATASLFFAVHPCHVESVAWLSSRKDLLSLTFALLATLAYTSARAPGRATGRYQLISLACYCAAIMSKMIVVLLPIFFLLIDRHEGRASEQRAGAATGAALRGKLPFLMIGVLLSAVNYRVQARVIGPTMNDPLEHLLVQGHAVWNYLLVLSGAVPGRPVYDLPAFGIRQPETFAALGGLAFAGLTAAALVLAWRRRLSTILLGAGWFVLMLLPALTFPLVTFMADRYLYAASLGFLWLLAAAIFATTRRIRSKGAAFLASGIIVAFCASLFALRALAYLPVWRNSEALWRHVIETSHSKIARNALAATWIRQGRFEEAEQLLAKSESPRDADTCRTLGILYDKKGQYPQAIREYERGIALCESREQCGPELLGALHFNSGVTSWHLRDYRASARAYERAFQVDPDNREARDWAAKARRLIR
jgi:hypothetical protein